MFHSFFQGALNNSGAAKLVMNGRQRRNINNLIGVSSKFNTLHDVEAYIESSFYSAHFILYYIFIIFVSIVKVV